MGNKDKVDSNIAALNADTRVHTRKFLTRFVEFVRDYSFTKVLVKSTLKPVISNVGSSGAFGQYWPETTRYKKKVSKN